MCKTYFDSDDVEHRALNRMVENFEKMYDIMYSADTFLTNQEKRSFQKCVMKFGESDQWLRQLSLKSGCYDFKITPKVHQAQHLPKLSRMINPRVLQVYAEESSVGRLARVWKKSKFGRYRRTIQRIVLVKLVVRHYLRWKGI